MAARRLHQRAVGVPLAGQRELGLGELRAVPLGAARLDVDRAEEAHRDLAAVALAAGRRRRRVEQVVPFLLGVEREDGVVAGGDEAVAVVADEGAVGGDGADELEPDGVHGGVARDGLVLVAAVRVEQILEGDLDAVARVHAQDERARALVALEPGVAGDEAARRVDGRHVGAQRVHHAGRVDGAEAVEGDDLIERHHVGLDGLLAIGRGHGRRRRGRGRRRGRRRVGVRLDGRRRVRRDEPVGLGELRVGRAGRAEHEERRGEEREQGPTLSEIVGGVHRLFSQSSGGVLARAGNHLRLRFGRCPGGHPSGELVSTRPRRRAGTLPRPPCRHGRGEHKLVLEARGVGATRSR